MRKAVIVLSSLAFRATFLCLRCCIQIEIDGKNEFDDALRGSGQAVIIVANHTSFLDVMLVAAICPLRVVGSIKMFVSSHLQKMPFLGTIVKAQDHLVVPFKASGRDGGFELDKQLMAERMDILKDHAADGGIAGWFPEGKINDVDPHEVQQFRAGGFVIPAEVDCQIWCVAFVGNSRCWPRDALVGGNPSRIGVRIVKMCDSSEHLLSSVGLPVRKADDKHRSVFLANACHSRIQNEVTALVHMGFTGRSRDSWDSE